MCSVTFMGRTLNLKAKVCVSCSETYQPASARQKWCLVCSDSTKVARMRLARYGLTEKQWVEMVAKYDGLCWVCLDNPAQVVDHDHETGRVRGALCRGCNMVLHYVERPDWWAAAKAYLGR